MKKTLAALAGTACLLCSSAANATLYKLDFTASHFGSGFFSDTPAPQNPVSGSVFFAAASPGAPITPVDAVDLAIGADLFGDGLLFGAIVNGVDVSNYALDDFYLILSSHFNVFGYAVDRGFDTWATQGITASFSEAAPAGADVHEPGAMIFLGLGLAGLTLSRRRLAGLS